MSFNKCLEHKDYEPGITHDDLVNDIANDTMFFDWDNACDIDPADYGYEYCEQCEKLIQVE